MQVPPNFYEEDMLKWTKKFETARETRKQEKTKMKSLGCFMPVGTKNNNVASTTQHKRRPSR